MGTFEQRQNGVHRRGRIGTDPANGASRRDADVFVFVLDCGEQFGQCRPASLAVIAESLGGIATDHRHRIGQRGDERIERRRFGQRDVPQGLGRASSDLRSGILERRDESRQGGTRGPAEPAAGVDGLGSNGGIGHERDDLWSEFVMQRMLDGVECLLANGWIGAGELTAKLLDALGRLSRVGRTQKQQSGQQAEGGLSHGVSPVMQRSYPIESGRFQREVCNMGKKPNPSVAEADGHDVARVRFLGCDYRRGRRRLSLPAATVSSSISFISVAVNSIGLMSCFMVSSPMQVIAFRGDCCLLHPHIRTSVEGVTTNW